MLFGVPEHKDAIGSGATDPDGILNVATRVAVAEVGDALVVQTDLCLDEFTDHGHCGVLDAQGRVDNDATLRALPRHGARAGRGRLAAARAQRHDGRPGRAPCATRSTRAGHTDTAILGYAAKYASAFYGPFREAVESSLEGDRRTYQLDPANRREGAREVAARHRRGRRHRHGQARDVLPRRARRRRGRPARCRSGPTRCRGEYAMIEAAAANGWIDRRAGDRRVGARHPSRRRRCRADLLGGRAGRAWLRDGRRR